MPVTSENLSLISRVPSVHKKHSPMRGRITLEKGTSPISESRTVAFESSGTEWGNIGTSIVVINALSQDDVIGNLFVIENPEDVSKFLDKNISIGPLLIETKGILTNYFPSSEFILKLNHDPEDSNSAGILISIPAHSPESDYDKLEAFDQEWWIDNIHRAKGKVCVMLQPL